ncbi:uncharacterized protein LOC114259319 [Camellia sinensis]|uniref:uncharacterized protein LOC114259319 n=1 Tax=Camellia sinensis TaxID=4442 RepID=UPI001036D1F1|nr:uncharacterized protein LOC114259319 [Camellia sinensis]
MSEDLCREGKLSTEQIFSRVLQNINSTLESIGKNIEQFYLSDLSVPSDKTDDCCKDMEDERNIRYFFIDGPGGTRKTFLYRAILATIRTHNLIALATTTSRVTASLLLNGRTAHSRFKIPIDVESKICCNFSKQSSLAKPLKLTALIIWDEASMARRQSIKALDELLKDVMDNNLLFGGKVVVFGGDFHQVLPIVPKSTINECINAMLVMSYIWHSLEKIKLTENMRAKHDPAFSNFLLFIGNGIEQQIAPKTIRIPKVMLLPYNKNIDPLQELITFAFSDFNDYNEDPLSLMNRAILTPKNDNVDHINEILIEEFPGDEHIYNSIDETIDKSQQSQYKDFFNSLSAPELPPHKLLLKENCPILMLRNINPSKGLCNGTRLNCRKFGKHVILAQIAVGDRKIDMVFLA